MNRRHLLGATAAIGGVYLDLWEELDGLEKIGMIHDSLNRIVTSAKRDDWWWVDALHMAMPCFARASGH